VVAVKLVRGGVCGGGGGGNGGDSVRVRGVGAWGVGSTQWLVVDMAMVVMVGVMVVVVVVDMVMGVMEVVVVVVVVMVVLVCVGDAACVGGVCDGGGYT
jgi:hypothetical protein